MIDKVRAMEPIAPLTRKEMIAAIEGKGCPSRVPMIYHFWCSPGRFGDDMPIAQEIMAKYPLDVAVIGIGMPYMERSPADDPSYKFINIGYEESELEGLALDERVLMKDWGMLDEVLERFPSAYSPRLIPKGVGDDGKYKMGVWWSCLFERFWTVRGMTNAFMDFYLYPNQVHRFFRAMTDFYKIMIKRAKDEGLGLNGIFTSDDLGTQTSAFFSLDIFREFFKPYYKEIIECAHENDMHFWLHACGNMDLFLPDFIEIGLDVIHPIQKYAMDEKAAAAKYQKDICFWAGFDVQQTIPYGTPDDVRAEVRFMIDTYCRSDGRLILTMGNQVTPDCKIDSLYALFDESYNYGIKKIKGGM